MRGIDVDVVKKKLRIGSEIDNEVERDGIDDVENEELEVGLRRKDKLNESIDIE